MILNCSGAERLTQKGLGLGLGTGEEDKASPVAGKKALFFNFSNAKIDKTCEMLTLFIGLMPYEKDYWLTRSPASAQ
jgi:hypothetical protein